MSELNTIYIISKGRPDCWTAQYLERISYPDDWFILCGDNDETVPEYLDNWGDERVIVFDHAAAWDDTDMMDSYGRSKPSGICPVKNEARRVSLSRNELRHWVWDDDYKDIVRIEDSGRHRIDDGAELHSLLQEIASFGNDGNLAAVGFGINNIKNSPKLFRTFDTKVFNCVNVANDDETFIPWRGRLYEDWIHSLDNTSRSTGEICFEHLYIECVNNPWGLDKNVTPGGLTELYESEEKAVTNIRECGYCLMVAPSSVTLTENPNAYRSFGKRAAMSQILPKRLSDKWCR